MKAIITTLALLLPVTAYANSDARHDRRLEQAAADIVASKIGEIRGGFGHNEKPEFVAGDRLNPDAPAVAFPRTATRDGFWKDGLAPARGIPTYRRGNI